MAQAPPPSVSLRQSVRGGGVLDPPAPNPEGVLRASRLLVLLIHGYNNDLAEGRRAFEAFRARQREVGQVGPDRPPTNVPLVDVYWPGDADWGIVSALYYPWAIERAKEAAPVLARAIDDAVRLGMLREIEILAHSLGCRLALELVRELRAVPGLIVRRVALMAAAVPVFMLVPGYPPALREACDAVIAKGVLSLFSPSDLVLAIAFPVGQTLGGGDEGFFPTALGHDYWASTLGPATLAQHEVAGAGHSDYWGHRDRTLAQAREAGTAVRRFLELGAIPGRSVAARSRYERAAPEPRQAAAEPRAVPARGVEAWAAP